MSRSTSFRKVSYMSPPGAASGPSTAAFRLSASTFTRTDSPMTFGSARMRTPVSPEPVPRHADVLAVKARRASELHALAGDEQICSAERAADLGVGLQREDRAVDVELRVRARVAAVRDREVEQLVPLRLDRLCHLLEKNPALGEAQRAQRRPAFAAGVVERRGEVEAVTRSLGKRLLGGGVDECLAGARSFDPLVAEVTRQDFHAAAPFGCGKDSPRSSAAHPRKIRAICFPSPQAGPRRSRPRAWSLRRTRSPPRRASMRFAPEARRWTLRLRRAPLSRCSTRT